MIHRLIVVLGFVLASELQTTFLEYEKKENTEALLQTVYLQLELGLSGSELVANLEEIISELKDQDQISTAIIANQQSFCEAENDKIEEIQKNINSLLETLNLLRPELEVLAGDIEKKESEIQSYLNEIQKSEQQRQDEKEKWIKKDKEIVESVEATIGAIRLITQTKYDDSGLDFVQKKIDSLAEILGKAVESVDKSTYSPIVAALSQITSSDEETVDSVLELLESLKNDLIQSKGEAAKLEETNSKNYLEYVSSIETAIESDTQDINSLKRKKQRLEYTVETTEKELDEDKLRKDLFERVSDEQKSLCDDWARLNLIESSERQEFIKKINEVIEMINTDFSGVKEYFSGKN